MSLSPSRLACLGLLAVSAASAAGLPDTGQDTCYNDTVADSVAASDPASISRDVGSHPRQDCRYGRDAAAAAGVLTKTGGGAKGFDYSKIANNGSVLAASAALGPNSTDWACTRDNVTGLMWEIKTDDNGLRDKDWTYTWYSTDAATNGGDPGRNVVTTTCGTPATLASCNTQDYVAAVNAAALCGYSDWRLPTLRELRTLVHTGTQNPSIDTSYFPNTPIASHFCSASTYVPNPAGAWLVNFLFGNVYADNKMYPYSARLVRGGPF